MCLTFPARVVALDGDEVIVEDGGRRRRASSLIFPDLAVGDWVYVAAGTVFRRLEHDEAAEISRTLVQATGETR